MKNPLLRELLDYLGCIPATATILLYEVVPRAGIEPAAFPLGGGRSIHWATGANRECTRKQRNVAFSQQFFV